MTGVAILSCVFVLYALMASRLDRLSITAPWSVQPYAGSPGSRAAPLARPIAEWFEPKLDTE